MKPRLFLCSVFALLLNACTSEIETHGYDLARWKNDKLACQGFRERTVQDFIKWIKPQLKGDSEREIIHHLGSPDLMELYRRSQKFYYYQLRKSQGCRSKKFDKTTMYLQIRINALNRVSGVVILKP